MNRKHVKPGMVVVAPTWIDGRHTRIPMLVWALDRDGACCYAYHTGQWVNEWVEFNGMHWATAAQASTMKLIRGAARNHELGHYRYVVLCAASLGAPDTIAAGCRRWTSFREANEYYTRMGDKNDHWFKRKAKASKEILAALKAKYDKALTKQRRAA